MIDRIAALALRIACAALMFACSPAQDPIVGTTVELPVVRSTATNSSSPQTPSPRPQEIEDGGPLIEGLVRFMGMVKPTKGGYELRGVIVDGDALETALKGTALTNKPLRTSDRDGFLGAKVRLTAELVKEGSDAPDEPGSPAEQRREGSYFRVARIVSAEVETPAMMIEGVLERSKGFFSLGDYLVAPHDLRWSLVALNGNFEKKRVRLWGQPHVIRCAPEAQCLVGGSLPIFAIGRAEVVTP
jgi:hypothetical protein